MGGKSYSVALAEELSAEAGEGCYHEDHRRIVLDESIPQRGNHVDLPNLKMGTLQSIPSLRDIVV